MSRLEILFPDWEFYLSGLLSQSIIIMLGTILFMGFTVCPPTIFDCLRSLQLSGYLQHTLPCFLYSLAWLPTSVISGVPWTFFSLHPYHPSTWKVLLLLTPHSTPCLAKFYIFFQSQLSFPVIHIAVSYAMHRLLSNASSTLSKYWLIV